MSQEHQEEQFLSACKSGDINQIKDLVANGFNVQLSFENNDNNNKHTNNDPNEPNKSAFWYAVHTGNVDVVKYLFENSSSFKKQRDFILRQSCRFGNLDTVKYIIKEGTDIYKGDGQAFVYACENGHLDIVKYFVSIGYYIHQKEDSAFRAACREEQLAVAQYLVDSGIDLVKNASVILGVARSSNKDFINFLIFDCDIQLNEEIRKVFNYLKEKNPENIKEIERLFNFRELNKKINAELSESNAASKRMKV